MYKSIENKIKKGIISLTTLSSLLNYQANISYADDLQKTIEKIRSENRGVIIAEVLNEAYYPQGGNDKSKGSVYSLKCKVISSDVMEKGKIFGLAIEDNSCYGGQKKEALDQIIDKGSIIYFKTEKYRDYRCEERETDFYKYTQIGIRAAESIKVLNPK